MGLWLGAVMVGMDRGLALFASVINVTKYITEPLKGGRIHLGSWFLTSFSPQWWGESGRIPGDGSCGKNGLQGVNQESVRKLEPQKGITSESRPLVTYVSSLGSPAPGFHKPQKHHHLLGMLSAQI